MFLSFSTSDEKGQCEPGFALEVKSFSIYGFTTDGLFFDIRHMDDEKERLELVSARRPFSPMSVGKRRNIMTVNIVEGFPNTIPISKAEFRERVGVGRLLNTAGHFVQG